MHFESPASSEANKCIKVHVSFPCTHHSDFGDFCVQAKFCVPLDFSSSSSDKTCCGVCQNSSVLSGTSSYLVLGDVRGDFLCTGWPLKLFQTSRWHQNKGCVLVHVPHTKTELLFWSQREVRNNLNGHPVVLSVSLCLSGCPLQHSTGRCLFSELVRQRCRDPPAPGWYIAGES